MEQTGLHMKHLNMQYKDVSYEDQIAKLKGTDNEWGGYIKDIATPPLSNGII